MRAATKIIFEMFDTDSKASSSLTCSDCQTDLNTLKNDVKDTSLYATTEVNGFLLDGNYKLLSEPPAGLYSASMSGTDGLFNTPVVVDVTFESLVTSSGITLHFPPEEYPSVTDIQWKREETVIHRGRFYPDSSAFFCQANVQEYDSLSLIFYGTQKPGHFLKLRGIDYGQSLLFSGEKIIKSNVMKDISILCDEISVNALEFEIEDKDRLFSVVGANSVFFAVQKSQRIIVYTNISATEEKIGVFYLKSLSGNGIRANFTAQDKIGLLDGEDELAEKYYDTTFGDFCEEILSGFRFEIEPSLQSKQIKGFLVTSSRREALQQACFAVGGIVDTGGDDIIKIFELPKVPSRLILREQIYLNGKVENILPYKSLSITAHNYDEDGIDDPVVFVKELNPKAKGKAEVRDAVFVNAENIGTVADRLSDYYNRKVSYRFKMPVDSLFNMGDMAMAYIGNNYIKGNITSTSLNLSGGLIAEVVIKGYVSRTDDSEPYTGEIYTGERNVI